MLALGLASSSLSAVASAACGRTQELAPTKDLPGRAPLAIGDSVLLGAAEEAAALGYAVDVRGCRQMSEGLEVLRAVPRRALPRLVVIALGSNSEISMREIRAALRRLGPRRTLALVTPVEIRGQPPTDARRIRRAARRWPTRIVVVDWARRAARRSELTGRDGIHLTPTGRTAMARMLRRALPYATGRRRPKGGSPDDPEPAIGDQDDPDSGGLQV